MDVIKLIAEVKQSELNIPTSTHKQAIDNDKKNNISSKIDFASL